MSDKLIRTAWKQTFPCHGFLLSGKRNQGTKKIYLDVNRTLKKLTKIGTLRIS